MCPVCGTPLGLATEAPQAQREREYIQSLIDDCRSKDEIKQALVAQFGEEVLALPGDEGDDDLGDVLVYVIPALGLLLAAGGIAFAVVRWRARPGRGRGRCAPRPPTAAASTATWSATTCDRADTVDTTVVAAFAVGFISFVSPVRAAARARLPVDDLGRLVRRHPGGPRARSGARPGAALLPRLHRDVRRARDDRHRPRPDAPGQPPAAAPDLGHHHRAARRALHRDAVRPAS